MVPSLVDSNYTENANLLEQLEDQNREVNKITVDAPIRRLSQWQNTDREQAFLSLSKGKYDLLVIPFQVTGHALDPTARSLMTLSLAQRIETATSLSVADPALVAKALGTTSRTIEKSEIDRLSNAIGVSHIIIGQTSQDRLGNWSLKITKHPSKNYIDNNENGILTFEKQNIAFDSFTPAYTSFLEFRDSIIHKLLPSFNLNTDANVSTYQPPDILANIIGEEKYPAIQLLQLLAALHPERNIDRARDSLLERSLVLTEYLNPAESEVQLLKARALLMLGRRSAALALIDGTKSADHLALKSYAMGNYSPSRLEQRKLTITMLIQELLFQRLDTSYHGAPDIDRLEYLTTQFETWSVLISIAFNDKHTWRDHSNIPLKYALDQYQPDAILSLDAIVSRQLITPTNEPEYEITKTVLEHLTSISQQLDISTDLGAHSQDYIELVRSMAINNVIDSIQHAFRAQGKTDTAYQIVNTFQPLLKDQPEFTLMSALALLHFSEDHQGKEKATLEGTAMDLARNGHAWSGRTSIDHSWLGLRGAELFAELGRLNPDTTDRLLFLSDRPSQTLTYTMNGEGDQTRRKLSECADSAVYAFDCSVKFYEHLVNNDADNTLISSLINDFQLRFEGHPKRLEFLANHYTSRNELNKANELYLNAVESGSSNWIAYSKLGNSLIERSRYSDARDIVMLYPGFTKSGVTDRVALSNRAHDFGSKLFWAGAYEEAKDLYEISAGYNTGSSAGMASNIRISILNGDFELAAQGSFDRARRYKSAYAMRDLTGLAILTGNLDWAWYLMDNQQELLKKPEAWMGALMAQRAFGKENQDILHWGMSRVRGENDNETKTLALRQLFLSATVDRNLTGTLSSQLANNDTRPPLMAVPIGVHMIGQNSPRPDPFFGRSQISQDTGTVLKQRIVYAAEALEALSKNDFSSAFDLLDEASNIYPLNEFLPYYAWAAAKTGQTDRIDLYIKNFNSNQFNKNFQFENKSDKAFDVLLAEALIYAVDGNHEKALASLVAANHQGHHTGSRHLPTRYQLLETARLIYLDSTDIAYRDFAVNLARRYSVIEPFQAYTHSFVALLSQQSDERIEALSKVLLLDPKSRSLATSTPSELSKAQEMAKAGYPTELRQRAGI